MEWSIPHVLTFEDRLTKQVNTDYALALANAWWDKMASERPSTGRKETWEFLLSTADIHLLDEGQMAYDELVSSFFEAENQNYGTGLKLNRNQWADDELGKATDWASQVGASMALAPQYQVVELIKNGESALAYDGKAFFADDHPINPFDASKGDYSNLTSGLPLVDGSGNPLPLNLGLAKALMRSYKMPNGRNRNLRPTAIVVPPTLEVPALTLAQSRIINATENVQGRDFRVDINGRSESGGLEVIVINELADVSEVDWYLVASNGGMGILPFIYSLREAYNMNSYTGVTDFLLNQMNELEWQVRGRNTMVYGNPYQMAKFKG